MWCLHGRLACRLLTDKVVHAKCINAARLITGAKRCEDITPILRQLHWLPVRRRVEFKMASLVYQVLSREAGAATEIAASRKYSNLAAQHFLRFDAMHKRGYCRQRCPSVRLSRSSVAPKRIKISSKFFHHRHSQAILVFPCQTGWQYSDGNPLTGASNAKGV